MTLSITSADIENMSPADRLTLISDLWNSLTDADVPLPPAQRAELERRLDNFDAEAKRANTWAEFKARHAERNV